MSTKKRRNTALNIKALSRVISAADAHAAEILTHAAAPHDADIDHTAESKCISFLNEKNAWVKMTNFTEKEIRSILLHSQPYRVDLTCRGPKPSISHEDGLIILLFWLKTASDFGVCAAAFGFGEAAVRTSLEHTKDWLLRFLRDRWWRIRQRPRAVTVGGVVRWIGLVVDSTTTQIYKPGLHNSPKLYMDGKNHIYGLKKEVAVLASPPHYAMFTSQSWPGSEHDFVAFQRNSGMYVTYLTKTPDEAAISADDSNGLWILLADSGYLGQAELSPGIRKLALKKPSSHHNRRN